MFAETLTIIYHFVKFKVSPCFFHERVLTTG